MYLKLLISFLISLLGACVAHAQSCTALGQNPSTAFPVCGTDTFSQTTVPYCGGRTIPGQCPAIEGLSDTNPFWYKFTCFTAGTLGFVITPMDLADDYDWQLFDITGRNPDDVYTDASLFVACNWSGNPGLTGASAAGNSLVNCAGYSYPTFSKMPTLQQGHNYILLVSHFTRFTPSQQGYTLSFKGGTASITDPTDPDVRSVTVACDASKLSIKLNKKMKCSSLAADGSDFIITSSTTGVVAAVGVNCNAGFDMDSIELQLANPLPPGNYTVAMRNGTDGNTLMDNCNRTIAEGRALPFTVVTLLPTPMDSLAPVSCAPQSLQLVFKKKILCSTIAADGSNFVVTGPSPVQVKGAAGACSGDGTFTIDVVLASPIVDGGTYRITLQPGSLGNTLVDECGQATPAGSVLIFSVKDTVSARFEPVLRLGCVTDTVLLSHPGGNGINSWNWTLADAGFSTAQHTAAHYTVFGKKELSLKVSNGFCTDSVSRVVDLNNELKADFEANNTMCPEDSAFFINKSVGQIIAYQWDFGQGAGSTLQDPAPHKYPLSGIETVYPVKLIVDNGGCKDTAIYPIKVLSSCFIAVPTAFTPNGDGLNDELYPLNAFKADDLVFRVYNRAGQLVFSSRDWMQRWNGTVNGEPQDSGMFVWTLQYVHRDTGKKFSLKGSTVLIR